MSVLNDANQNDAVKFHAVKALNKLFTAGVMKQPAVVAPSIDALIDQINREFGPGTPQDERDGFHYFRREVIRTLGATRFPAHPQAKKGRPAEALARIMNRTPMSNRPPVWTSGSRQPSAWRR